MVEKKYPWVEKLSEERDKVSGELKQKYRVYGVGGQEGIFVSTNGYDKHIAEMEARNAKGRYTFDEATKIIASNVGARNIHTAEKELYKKLERSVLTDTIPYYEPGCTMRHVSRLPIDIVLGEIWEVHWDELNNWLATNEPKITYRFPDPKNLSDITPQVLEEPLGREAAQEKAIITQLNKMGIDPLKLPKQQSGKSGIKSEVREKLQNNLKVFSSLKVFDKAWARLLSKRELKYVE